MKKIAKSLMPLAVLVLFGTCLTGLFGFLVMLTTSVGLADGVPLFYYYRLNIPIISVALPIAGMILFIAILLGSSSKSAEAVESTAVKGSMGHSANEEGKDEENRLKAVA
ncbi:MAG TPA: hypothetical protein VIM99_04140 [Blastocatellia bacterium]